MRKEFNVDMAVNPESAEFLKKMANDKSKRPPMLFDFGSNMSGIKKGDVRHISFETSDGQKVSFDARVIDVAGSKVEVLPLTDFTIVS